ncbi:hypothetical protein GCM10009841_30320 [Microlunatus panaciterrae]|uniref:tRNA A37 threonylcarbamoyltransferase TsaD n=1 Tax=Microlunatus panaciterrae TaxID=400768 RepID=A0ABS2RGM8_9ACTN|nr:hypothetical protein [Microlunatus panaciterrae]MBM7797692.1 tRNA A37 threonylcarbamoyltransferase TsaD [Microlunatus panaciterrae]
MQDELATMTLSELLIELAELERAIGETESLTSLLDDSAGEHLAINARLAGLTGREARVAAELARRGSVHHRRPQRAERIPDAV